MDRSVLVEQHKKPGVRYARTADGLELAVLDVTHPAFHLSWTEAEQRELTQKFLTEPQPLAQVPAFVRKLIYRIVLRKSLLAQGLRRADGTFLSGIATYLLKLGADNLPSALAQPVDSQIAASLPVVATRVRTVDIAKLLADALAPALRARAGASLYLANLAGGPATDSLNALILLRRDEPQTLAGRSIVLQVLDQDDAGPLFGAHALAALREPEAPLEGLDIEFRHTKYDWSRPQELGKAVREACPAEAVVAASSEGGLFEYGSDEEIVDNLTALRGALGDRCPMVGSVTRADAPVRRLRRMDAANTRMRGLDTFRALVERAGWTVARAIERPFSDHVTLMPMEHRRAREA